MSGLLSDGLSANPVIGLVGCIICGFSVGIMWPGTISISGPSSYQQVERQCFALLAMSGETLVEPLGQA